VIISVIHGDFADIVANPSIRLPSFRTMIRTFSPGRVVATTFLTVMVLALAASPGQGQAPAKEPDHNKQIAELEKQIAELQAKLKAIKDKRAPMPRVADEGVPAAWVNKFQWRSIGPATMGGRITSIAVFEADPTTYWVATASGGLLKTTNNGRTFEHQFERESTVSIGAVAVAPSNKEIVWVGTGEANPRNSVSYGDGVYKSTDGGKTWKNMGLKSSYQIGDIAIHPTNPDIVYVAALGRLYGPGGERGLFKTEDGGKSWKSLIPLDDKTGAMDIAMHPSNPDTLLVSTWERQRDEFDSFRGEARDKKPGGTDEYAPIKVHAPGSAIYRTTDGGKTFAKLSKGLPQAKLGRIGFDWSRKDPKTIFAIIDTEKAGMGKPPPRVYVGMQSETQTGAGVKITSVTDNTPAAKAGLKVDDIITAIGGKEVKTYEAMIDDFRARNPGDKVKFAVSRGKEKVEVELTFDLHPNERPVLGVNVGGEAPEGVTLTDVQELGAAAKAGLKPGDIITAIGGTPVKATRDIAQAMRDRKAGDKVKVSFIRAPGKQPSEVTVELLAPVVNTRPFGHPMLGGQNANVQDQQGPVGNDTGGLYKSTDGGESWTRINSVNPRPFYFSVVCVDPTDDNTIYVLGVDLQRSTDGGKKFESTNINRGLHSDQHAMWINPKNSRHIVIGTDGGFYTTYDKCATWDHMSHAAAIGQFYHVAVDNRMPYRVYGGLQDNGSWGGPSRSDRWAGPINNDWHIVSWGDGFVCRVDPIDPDIIYSESQDGNILRTNMRTGAVTNIRPEPSPALGAYRFNWNTPFILSAHNSSIFYSAGNYVFRSYKRGAALQAVSPEITLTKRGSGTALSESPRSADIVWAGTDDGAVWLTKDGCKTWTNLSDKFLASAVASAPGVRLPGPRWVSSIEASKWADGRCYVVFDAHRSNDDEPYVFKTEDFGQTWTSLRGNLPTGSTRVLREDIANPNLLYLGTEFAGYASIDGGKHWTRINGEKGLPTVAVHEFAQPTTANDLVVATHGRSVWVLDVTPLRQLTKEIVAGKTTLLSPSPAVQWKQAQNQPFSESIRAFYGQNPPRGAQIDYVIGKKAENAELRIVDVRGNLVRQFPAATEPGYYRVTWDLRRDGGGKSRGPSAGGPKGKGKGPNPIETPPTNFNPLARAPGGSAQVPPGDYRVVLSVDGTDYVQALTVEADPSAPKSGIATGDESEATEEQPVRKDD
jgi:photosystem II stability/assembly factor-like uncharacterized protein